ncbi:MAG: class II fructose-bisphosphate aldolase [Candidatus Sungbacteria bacterium]|nr:class II fructose-bisphosphate aldolase [Candidatus Sungbacteria bacterium]
MRRGGRQLRMRLMLLREILKRATEEGWATGHFNVSEMDQMRAIVEACYEVGAPAIIGTSEGEAKHFGYAEAIALRDVFREEYGIPIFLNADHHKSVEAAKKAVDAGYDSVHIDLSALPFEENLVGTKEIVDYARQFSIQHSAFSISVEGELGYLRGESKIQKEKIEIQERDYTDPGQAREFVEKTGVDRLAIAVGNIHGISLDEPALDIERIRAIRQAIPENVALVLHAGSGIPDDQIRAAIDAGISNIHINTDIRVAYLKELKKTFVEKPDEAAMYKLDTPASLAMKEVLKEKLKLFGVVNKI